MIKFIKFIAFTLGLAFWTNPAYATDVTAFGAIPNDGIDDSVALQAAFDSLSGGGVLTFTSGRYDHNKQLFVNGNDITVDGTGAHLFASNPTRSALTLEGNNIVVKGLELSAVGTTRLTPDRTCGLLVYRSHDIRFEANRVHGFGGCGIMLQTTDGFLIQGNVVYDTLADGIHITNKSLNGAIDFNTTMNTGDDGIALIGYMKDGDIVHDVTITNNHVLGNTWGRGITAEGAHSVLIDSNYVYHTSAAGILLTSSTAYNTYDVKDIEVSNNTVIETNYNTSVVHGAILLAPRSGFTVDTVSIHDNTVVDTIGANSHLRILNFSYNVSVTNNHFVDADSSHKAWSFYQGAQVQQSGNTYNGNVIP